MQVLPLFFAICYFYEIMNAANLSILEESDFE